MTRQEQKDARREEILNMGLDLFVRNGYYGTTTKEIAENLGISPGLMFHYFGSKDELYMELLNRLTKGIANTMTAFDPSEMNPLEMFEHIVALIIGSFRSHPQSTKLYMLAVQARICTRLTDEIRTAAQGIDSDAFETLIAAGQISGVIRDGDPKALAGLVHSTLQGIAHTSVCFPDIPLPESTWVVDMLRKP